jgi:hypothetical protein
MVKNERPAHRLWIAGRPHGASLRRAGMMHLIPDQMQADAVALVMKQEDGRVFVDDRATRDRRGHLTRALRAGATLSHPTAVPQGRGEPLGASYRGDCLPSPSGPR